MDKSKYYQDKYEYYKRVNFWAVLSIGIPSMGYFFSDCYLIGEFSTQTLIPRMSVLVSLAIFIIANMRTNNYRIMVPLSYLVGHGVMWGTIWSCTYLEDLSFACVGFFIVMFTFVAFGIAAPLKYEIIGMGLLFADITIANTFLHYPDFAMMILLGIPLYIGIVGFDFAIEGTFKDQHRMKKKLEEHLQHDMLTGTYNRNIFERITDENGIFAFAGDGQYTIAMYDIDKFKHVNDTYGHPAGDDVLVKVSKRISDGLLDGEYLVRWGGEEFVLVLKGNIEKSEKRLNEIRKSVEAMKLSVGKVTISVGLTEYHGQQYQDAIGEADKALYEAKNNGRNQVVVYS